MGNSVNTATARLNYEKGQQILQNAGMDPNVHKLTQGFLRLENTLVIGKTTYLFPFLVNQVGSSGTIFPTEQRLNQQDSFIASQLAIFLSTPTALTSGDFVLHSYPNPQFFATTNLAKALETIYNGFLTITVNNDVQVPAWDLSRHRLVPETQQGVGVTAETVFPLDQLDLSTDGFYPVEPNLVVIGSKNSILTMTLPAPLAVADATTRISIIIRGLVAQNSTIIS
jgi:hypothetical protein